MHFIKWIRIQRLKWKIENLEKEVRAHESTRTILGLLIRSTEETYNALEFRRRNYPLRGTTASASYKQMTKQTHDSFDILADRSIRHNQAETSLQQARIALAEAQAQLKCLQDAAA